jgi:hypothetical protein
MAIKQLQIVAFAIGLEATDTFHRPTGLADGLATLGVASAEIRTIRPKQLLWVPGSMAQPRIRRAGL